jgi:peptidoglycan/LPS O-acetylase OafA/YrhL
LFFTISGFILSMPFMRNFLGLAGRPISLRKYFLRRVRRLEPPYIIATFLLFLILVFVIRDKFAIGDLIISLFSSLFYVNNFVFPGELPHINAVTWSLEVEVQFYLIAPFLVWLLYRVRRTARRRLTIFLLIVAFAILSWYSETIYQVRVISLLNCIQYFLGGILLCDLVLLNSNEIRRADGIAMFLLGVLFLIFLVTVPHVSSPNILLKIASPISITAFYLIVFGNTWWNRFFSFNVLTLIGGMCYTIYLLHTSIISGVGRLAADRLIASNYFLYFGIQALVYLAAILVISAIYFLLVEKPCMKRDWYLQLPFFASRYLKKKSLPESYPLSSGLSPATDIDAFGATRPEG